MAYDELLAGRLKLALDKKGTDYTEKKMFGGVAYMVDDKMCVGIVNNNIMARIDPEIQEQALKKPGCILNLKEYLTKVLKYMRN